MESVVQERSWKKSPPQHQAGERNGRGAREGGRAECASSRGQGQSHLPHPEALLTPGEHARHLHEGAPQQTGRGPAKVDASQRPPPRGTPVGRGGDRVAALSDLGTSTGNVRNGKRILITAQSSLRAWREDGDS